jgi:glycosyltransferase involved in cell wall biosynthesis
MESLIIYPGLRKTLMSSKPEIVFSFPACMGGVASFNYNIINNSRLIKNFKSRVVLLKAEEDERPLFQDEFLADEVVTFKYSQKDNKYRLLKRLNAILGSGDGLVVTDNSLTIEAARLSDNPKTIFTLLHDYFYVRETIQLGDLVDAAIAHSSFFSDAVFASSPSLFSGRSFYIPYGVKTRNYLPPKNNSVLRLVFLGRLVEEKGVKLLYEINKLLLKKYIHVEWTLIGKGPLKEFLKDQWKGHRNIAFHEPSSTSIVYELLSMQDILILPTMFEGTPVSILECLSNGVVPIVNDLPGGIRDIVTENIGFRCRINELKDFTEAISCLAADKNKMVEMQNAGFQLSNRSFDIKKNADNYFVKFLEYERLKRTTRAGSVRFSNLDKSYLPNTLVKWIRTIK